MSKIVFHKSSERGHANHGWLDSYHSFSFSNFYDEKRINFGALRVLNDDTVKGGMGFGKHPHQNMEIISIPLQGDLLHEDSMGNKAVIKSGDVQIMSAGSGIYHSEKNKNHHEAVKFLQIWIIPNEQNGAPAYGQISLKLEDRQNKLQLIVSPDSTPNTVHIRQNSWLHIGRFDKNQIIDYTVKATGNGVYCFVISGEFKIENQFLGARDAVGISDTGQFIVESVADNAEILFIEVPMIF